MRWIVHPRSKASHLRASSETAPLSQRSTQPFRSRSEREGEFARLVFVVPSARKMDREPSGAFEFLTRLVVIAG